jgi:hypothetical protein
MRSLRFAACLAAAAALVLLPVGAGAKTKAGKYTLTFKGTTKQGEKISIVVKYKLELDRSVKPPQLVPGNNVTASATSAATVHCDAKPEIGRAAVDKRYELKGSISQVHFVLGSSSGDLSGFMGGPADSAGANIGGSVKMKDLLPKKNAVLKGSISASSSPPEAGGDTCIAGDPQKGIAFSAKLASAKRK